MKTTISLISCVLLVAGTMKSVTPATLAEFDLKLTVTYHANSVLIGTKERCDNPPEVAGAAQWRRCVHDIGTGARDVLLFQRSSINRSLADVGASQWLSLEGIGIGEVANGEHVFVVPSKSLRVVLTECTAWGCKSAGSISGKVYLQKATSEAFLFVDVRGKPQGAKDDYTGPPIGILERFYLDSKKPG